MGQESSRIERHPVKRAAQCVASFPRNLQRSRQDGSARARVVVVLALVLAAWWNIYPSGGQHRDECQRATRKLSRPGRLASAGGRRNAQINTSSNSCSRKAIMGPNQPALSPRSIRRGKPVESVRQAGEGKFFLIAESDFLHNALRAWFGYSAGSSNLSQEDRAGRDPPSRRPEPFRSPAHGFSGRPSRHTRGLRGSGR